MTTAADEGVVADETREGEMAGLAKREQRDVPRIDVFDRFDRMFEDWLRMLPSRRGGEMREWAEDMIRVDQFKEDGDVVVRAEIPGIDPEKDVEVTLTDGMLHIRAQRREEEKTEERGYVRQELRYGSFSRDLQVPEGIGADDVKARYQDGILEIRVPAPTETQPKKIEITKS
jgi:HSP20 family protein